MAGSRLLAHTGKEKEGRSGCRTRKLPCSTSSSPLPSSRAPLRSVSSPRQLQLTCRPDEGTQPPCDSKLSLGPPRGNPSPPTMLALFPFCYFRIAPLFSEFPLSPKNRSVAFVAYAFPIAMHSTVGCPSRSVCDKASLSSRVRIRCQNRASNRDTNDMTSSGGADVGRVEPVIAPRPPGWLR